MGRIVFILAIAAAIASATLASAAEVRAKRGPAKLGGTAAGPIIGGLVANNGYYAYGPYYAPGPLIGSSRLYGPALPVTPGCYTQRQRIWTDYGWVWRRAPICY
jgi:hypothetical protein